MILAIDDLHLLDDSTVKGESTSALIFRLLMNQRLRQVHFLLASRSMPRLHITRLRLQGELEVIDEHDLAFDEQELAQYLRLARRRPADAAEIARRHRETGGWITAIALTELNPSPKSISGADGLFGFLDEEVWPLMPVVQQQFAARAAALHAIDAELCDHALERSDSSICIDDMIRRTLFVERAGSSGTTVRFHALFAGYLLSKLSPGEIRSIRQRAGEFYAARKEWLQAIQYFGEAEAWDQLALVAEEHGSELAYQGHGRLVASVLEQMHRRTQLSPALLLLLCDTTVQGGPVDLGEAILAEMPDPPEELKARKALLELRIAHIAGRHLEAVAIAREELEQGRASPREEALLHRSAGTALRSLGRYDDAEQHFMHALHGLEALHEWAEAAYVKRHIGIISYQQGEWDKAERFLSESVAMLRQVGRLDYLPSALNHLANVYIEFERFDEALQMVLEARDLMRAQDDHYYTADICSALGVVYRCLGDMQRAVDAFHEGAGIAVRIGYRPMEQLTLLQQAMALAEMGRFDDAEQCLARAAGEPSSREVAILKLLVDCRFAWLKRDFQQVREVSERLLALVEESGNLHYQRGGRLFRLGALAALDAPAAEVHQAATEFVRTSRPRRAAWTYADVVSAVKPAVASHPDPAVRDHEVWTAGLKTTGPVAAAPGATRHPNSLEVSVLQPSLRIAVDGRVRTGGWGRALDLLLYLVHCPEGGTALQISQSLWSSQSGGQATQRRFHTMAAALRRALGKDLI
ncbi:MAG: tetratricopeptide repeat protein, partial [Chloroflexota bacterium]|nr:tetratricopeptide repeat protein [Chloroflexota bacterium]